MRWTWLITDVNFDHRGWGSVSPGFSTVKLFFFSPSMLYSLEGSLCKVCTLEVESYVLLPQGWSCLVAHPCLTLCDPMDCSPSGSSVHGDSPGKNTGAGCHALLWGWSTDINYLKFICTGDLSLLPHLFIYLTIYLNPYGFIDSCFILLVIIQHYVTSFVAQIVSDLAT